MSEYTPKLLTKVHSILRYLSDERGYACDINLYESEAVERKLVEWRDILPKTYIDFVVLCAPYMRGHGFMLPWEDNDDLTEYEGEKPNEIQIWHSESAIGVYLSLDNHEVHDCFDDKYKNFTSYLEGFLQTLIKSELSRIKEEELKLEKHLNELNQFA